MPPYKAPRTATNTKKHHVTTRGTAATAKQARPPKGEEAPPQRVLPAPKGGQKREERHQRRRQPQTGEQTNATAAKTKKRPSYGWEYNCPREQTKLPKRPSNHKPILGAAMRSLFIPLSVALSLTVSPLLLLRSSRKQNTIRVAHASPLGGTGKGDNKKTSLPIDREVLLCYYRKHSRVHNAPWVLWSLSYSPTPYGIAHDPMI